MSLLGVLLFTSGVMMLIMINQHVNDIEDKENELFENKILMIMKEMEEQLDFMNDVLLDVSYRKEFKYNYIKKSKYNEIVAMDLMKSYVGMNNIWNMCFVKYSSYDNILASNTSVTPIQVYLSNLYSEESSREVLELIDEMYRARKKVYGVYNKEKTTLFLLPLVRYNENNENKIVLGFEVSYASIEKRIKDLVGELDGYIQIKYNEKIIYESDALLGNTNVLERLSYSDDFQIYYMINKNEFFSYTPLFDNKTIGILVFISPLIMLFLFAITFWSHRPVRKLLTKYNFIEDSSGLPTLESIDEHIEILLKSREVDRQALQKQYKVLIEQITYMVISGSNVDMLKNHLKLMNIDYEDFTFGVVSCDISDSVKNTDVSMLTAAIGDLSGQEIQFYPCYYKEIGLKVLVRVEDVYQFKDAMELLSSLFETMKLDIVSKIIASSSNLESWLDFTQKESELAIESIKVSENQKGIVEKAIEYINQHYCENSIDLNEIALILDIHPVYLSRSIKQVIGIGYKDYLMQLRVEKAKEMLKDPYVVIADVGEKIGYANSSHFIKIFQKYTGLTPAKYRDMNCDK